MKRQKLKWSEEEIQIVIDYYLSLDCITNKDRVIKTWNDLYNNNNKFAHYREFNTMKAILATEVKKRNIIPFAYKDLPKGFRMIPKTNWHCMDKSMNVLNMKTGKFLKLQKMPKNTVLYSVRMKEDDLSITRTASRIYVELFLEPSKPYQLDENGVPFQTDMFKIRGKYAPKIKSFNEWLV